MSDTHELRIVRTFAASPERVFAAWTQPDLMRQWFTFEPYSVDEAEADPRVGGKWKLVGSKPGEGPHTTTGEYLELEPGRRLVKTWNYDGPAGKSDTLVAVDFRELEPGVTELTLVHSKMTAEDLEGGSQGWGSILDSLEAWVASAA